MPHPPRDTVDRITDEWDAVRPDLDSSPIDVIGRISRLSRLVDRRLAANFARHGIENWMYDVMATLRRRGEPFELAAGDLVAHTMVTTGAITNRIDRLAERGLVERDTARGDRRKVVVRLTPDGLALVDEVVTGHLAVEREILAAVPAIDRDHLTATLRALLLGLGDTDRETPAS